MAIEGEATQAGGPKQWLEDYFRMITGFNADRIPTDMYNGIPGLLQEEGKFYEARRLPAEYRKMRIRQCFNNALLMACWYPNLRYCEGLAHGVLPVHHAWCLDENDEVVDPTWKLKDRELSEIGYYGVVIPTEVVRMAVITVDRSGILDLWGDGHPFLYRPWDPEAALRRLTTTVINRKAAGRSAAARKGAATKAARKAEANDHQ